jgi:hypothetical protein
MITRLAFEQEDENDYVLTIVGEDSTHSITFTTSEAVDLYDAVVAVIAGYVFERDAARREYDTGIADDPTQQPVLDRIKDEQ